ncbi:hypothetical protein HZH68_003944 [Vespula germanica]|uniref:Uncharacterized protein n=1 Tax=Vespula germanica TaxID=30212 RepID=A0A834NJC4_VESGE|nr:hypothetical protein HZH68_003944 [Vespula germanica]
MAIALSSSSSSFELMDLFSLAIPTNLVFVTLLAFISLPFFLFLYPASSWSRKCWINFVKWKYPNCIVVEENNIRSILDQGRNHGIYTLLVQGRSIAEGTRSHLLHLTSKKKFLRLTLTTKWGLYVWKDNEQFSVCTFIGLKSVYRPALAASTPQPPPRETKAFIHQVGGTKKREASDLGHSEIKNKNEVLRRKI